MAKAEPNKLVGVIGIVGSGNLARALVRGWSEPVVLTDSGSGRARDLAAEVGGRAAGSNAELARDAGVVVLCHKPAQLDEVALEIAGDAKAVISTLARVTLADLQAAYPGTPVARVMPSIAAELRQGVTVLAAESAPQTGAAELFARVGSVTELAEEQMEAATAIAGVGPAYAARVVEAWTAAGVEHGLDPDQAGAMAVASLAGGAALIVHHDGQAATVREAVSSPGGVTLKGLAALEDAGIDRAFAAATDAVVGR